MIDFLFICRHCSCLLVVLIGDPSRRYCVRCIGKLPRCRTEGCDELVADRERTPYLCDLHREAAMGDRRRSRTPRPCEIDGCDRSISTWNKSGVCALCQQRPRRRAA